MGFIDQASYPNTYVQVEVRHRNERYYYKIVDVTASNPDAEDELQAVVDIALRVAASKRGKSPPVRKVASA